MDLGDKYWRGSCALSLLSGVAAWVVLARWDPRMAWAVSLPVGYLSCLLWLYLLTPRRPLAVAAAVRQCAADHPTYVGLGGAVRAIEELRVVVAVFYSETDVISKPKPYRLYAVDRGTLTAEELPLGPEHPYWLHGRR